MVHPSLFLAGKSDLQHETMLDVIERSLEHSWAALRVDFVTALQRWGESAGSGRCMSRQCGRKACQTDSVKIQRRNALGVLSGWKRYMCACLCVCGGVRV